METAIFLSVAVWGSEIGPLSPSAAFDRHRSNQGISRRRRAMCVTGEHAPMLK
jgi:hypothetical protein